MRYSKLYEGVVIKTNKKATVRTVGVDHSSGNVIEQDYYVQSASICKLG
jgi:hypothetical protein